MDHLAGLDLDAVTEALQRFAIDVADDYQAPQPDR
jgi:hypothetical protein